MSILLTPGLQPPVGSAPAEEAAPQKASSAGPIPHWRILQEARKAASLTEDFPLSQSPTADQWKE